MTLARAAGMTVMQRHQHPACGPLKSRLDPTNCSAVRACNPGCRGLPRWTDDQSGRVLEVELELEEVEGGAVEAKGSVDHGCGAAMQALRLIHLIHLIRHFSTPNGQTQPLLG